MDAETAPLIIVLGPTAVGKSRVAVNLALRFGGEVISGDSIQVYRGFDIGTDKPGPEARRGVPHHLIDIVGPEAQYTAADFVRDALAAARAIAGRGRLPFVAGGTGLYLKALVDGLFPGPGRDPDLRRALEAEAGAKGLDALFRRLESADPEYARRIRSRDRVRIIRALEVLAATGRPLSEHFRETRSPLAGRTIVRIGLALDREALCRRIEERVDRMFDRGLVEEVRALLARGVPASAAPFRALGYRHVVRHLAGEIGLAEAVSLTKTETRQYAKRQMTWFRKMAGVDWFSPDDGPALEEHVRKRLK
ncbi:MAG TPA: tRNA (adenosine(37)-N6)-dimethylallyltransferase MiaA [Candidatus Aminicenantes bacterium]|nr:tRNA (adenosine(37)-N6)-dimethylallyltransferase MiaA [Candidatus Aminicenantes bacterium]HRY63750.1 tRNA (adenosine(37)-N6)-dimethylallyltransferase MiaA [Candidatus Aminicenantes bacterium]HRZ70663.1 tRNA (adenosine(37)-N6)-dimethylallyltransferase MiaA [Candidatus Aminicenantes bacterium]